MDLTNVLRRMERMQASTAMIIAETKLEDEKFSISIPRANITRAFPIIVFNSVIWTTVLIYTIATNWTTATRSDILGGSWLIIPPLFCIVLLIRALDALRNGINFTFDKSDDTVRYNGKQVGKLSSVARIKISKMRKWPSIWLVFTDRRNLLVLNTHNFSNMPRGGLLSGSQKVLLS